MDTKLKRINRSIWMKAFSFVITMGLIIMIVIQSFMIDKSGYKLESIFEKDYIKSNEFRYGDLDEVYYSIPILLDDIYDEVVEIVEIVDIADSGYEGEGVESNGHRGEVPTIKEGEEKAMGDVTIHWLKDELRDVNWLYYIVTENDIYQNASLDEVLAQKNYLFQYKDGKWSNSLGLDEGKFYHSDVKEITFSFSDSYIEQKQVNWNVQRQELIPRFVIIMISLCLIILNLIHLCVVTGRVAEDEELHYSRYVDKIYTDVQLGIGGVTAYYWLDQLDRLFNQHGYGYNKVDQFITILSVTSITVLATFIGGLLILSLARRIKGQTIFTHSLIYVVIMKIIEFVRLFIYGKNFEANSAIDHLQRRQIVFIGLSAANVFWFFLARSSTSIFPLVLEIVLIYWYLTSNKKEFDQIQSDMDIKIEEQMKAERMKVDLVTNVSHDLKTPLTSIISYVELLSQEELNDAARDYVKILHDKSERLKHIVSDLFDLAKSTSGNMSMDFEVIDLRKLIEQTLADMGDEIERSGLQVKMQLTPESAYIHSDGKKLYRVLQNVIGNALKYSLQGTRIYIQMEQRDQRIRVLLKNTAGYEMDFTAEEVLQRFQRGDKSRSSEGSGLGLSIAESFTKACGGTFAVEVDGDQFKVTMEFVTIVIES